MRSRDTYVVAIPKLEAGLPLRYDLTTLDGALLARTGTRITPELIDRWLDQGITQACIVQGRQADPADPLLRPYDAEMTARLEANLARASEAVLEVSERIGRRDELTPKAMGDVVEVILADVELDVAAALATACGLVAPPESPQDRLLAQRSSQLAILAMAIGCMMELAEEDRQALGMAGLLHDVSLLQCTAPLVQQIGSRFPVDDPYFSHPQTSGYLLESILGVTPRIGLAVAQLHEQPDGTGFPHGWRAHRIMPLARILNVADAYLTLTSAEQADRLPKGCNLNPSDAIAYLMHHGSQGRFDRDAVRGLIRVMSLYPVGTRVKLSDDSVGVVLRSTESSPLRPIVRLDGRPEKIVDLRGSHLSIVQPLSQSPSRHRRMDKSQLGQILWL